MAKFSVLIPVHSELPSQYLSEMFRSIRTPHQTLPPNEIVLIKDGSLTPELDKEIGKHERELAKESGTRMKVIAMAERKGAGLALNVGIKACTHEIVARMDSDDLAFPDRFKKQIGFLERHPDIDVLGSTILEFENHLNEPFLMLRDVPPLHEGIVKIAKKRSPFNHTSVMYRKKAVLDAGNYQDLQYFEDYVLWTRMIQNGVKTANLKEPLVAVRTGNRMLKKRRGLKYATSEHRFLKILHNARFLSFSELLRNHIRVLARFLPYQIVRLLYRFPVFRNRKKLPNTIKKNWHPYA